MKEDEHDEVNEEGEQELTLSKIEGEIQEDISENDDEGDTVFLDLSTIQHSTSEVGSYSCLFYVVLYFSQQQSKDWMMH